MPDWHLVAEEWDAVHLSFAGSVMATFVGIEQGGQRERAFGRGPQNPRCGYETCSLAGQNLNHSYPGHRRRSIQGGLRTTSVAALPMTVLQGYDGSGGGTFVGDVGVAYEGVDLISIRKVEDSVPV